VDDAGGTLSGSPLTRALLTGLLFAATLAGVLRRPRGWHEAWFTCSGAALALGPVRPSQALQVIEAGKDALLSRPGRGTPEGWEVREGELGGLALWLTPLLLLAGVAALWRMLA